MYCTRKVTDDITFAGSEDRRLGLFEGVYPIPRGVSYNSYIILDEKTAVLDSVDKAVSEVYLENIDHTLAGRQLDYLVVHHMEPDHSATMLRLLEKHPETTLVTGKKALDMVSRFFGADLSARTKLVAENDVLNLGKHELKFISAPMVHWPEVMVSFDLFSGALFSADAFGTFGALDGAVFADEVDFDADYMADTRRYYTNIVGKYGAQVQSLLKKISLLDIKLICPLHGPVWRKDLNVILEKYDRWSRYEPEEKGVTIAYGSIYGHTENAANILAAKLRDRGVKVSVFDSSVSHPSEIIASAFRYPVLVLASSTYNGGVFVNMENLLHDLAAHNLQGRTVAIMQNGTWAATAGAAMKKIVESMKNITLLDNTVTIPSALSPAQEPELDALADAIADSLK